jgi:hypothetical protein
VPLPRQKPPPGGGRAPTTAMPRKPLFVRSVPPEHGWESLHLHTPRELPLIPVRKRALQQQQGGGAPAKANGSARQLHFDLLSPPQSQGPPANAEDEEIERRRQLAKRLHRLHPDADEKAALDVYLARKTDGAKVPACDALIDDVSKRRETVRKRQEKRKFDLNKKNVFTRCSRGVAPGPPHPALTPLPPGAGRRMMSGRCRRLTSSSAS